MFTVCYQWVKDMHNIQKFTTVYVRQIPVLRLAAEGLLNFLGETAAFWRLASDVVLDHP